MGDELRYGMSSDFRNAVFLYVTLKEFEAIGMGSSAYADDCRNGIKAFKLNHGERARLQTLFDAIDDAYGLPSDSA